MTTYQIYWTLSTDATPHQRAVEVSVPSPITRPTTAVENALLALPPQETNRLSVFAPRRLDHHPTEADLLAIIAHEAETRTRSLEEVAQAVLTHVQAELRAWRETQADLPGLAQCHREIIPATLAQEYDATRREQAVQQETERVRRNAAEKIAEQAREAAREKEQAARIEQGRQRNKYIAAWAAEHGSERLRGQVALGLDGWPLYLHERLEHDLPGAELDNDGENAPVRNPDGEHVAEALALRERLAALGYDAPVVDCVRITWEEDADEEGPRTADAVVFDGYRPGPADMFAAKTVRILV